MRLSMVWVSCIPAQQDMMDDIPQERSHMWTCICIHANTVVVKGFVQSHHVCKTKEVRQVIKDVRKPLRMGTELQWSGYMPDFDNDIFLLLQQNASVRLPLKCLHDSLSLDVVNQGELSTICHSPQTIWD